jgi:sulfite exporter TauE/SafE
MSAALLGAFLAGLAGSPHCVLMCGPFAAACVRASGAGGVLAWHLGRVASYAALGALAGLAGGAVPGPPWLTASVGAALLLWFAAALAGLVPEPRLLVPGAAAAGRLLAARTPAAQFAFGLVNGLIPCGLVYSALSLPVALGSPGAGALAMALFGAGTSPALSVAAAGFRRLELRTRAARRTVALLVLLAGLWALAARTGLLVGPAGHGVH